MGEGVLSTFHIARQEGMLIISNTQMLYTFDQTLSRFSRRGPGHVTRSVMQLTSHLSGPLVLQ